MSYTDSIFRSRVGRSVDKDALQHNRINDRIGPQSRFQTAGTLISQPDQSSDFYVSQKQRFNKNFDTYDRVKREHSRLKQQNFYDLRKEKRLQKDQERWNHIKNRDQYDEKKRLYHQEVLLDNKRNSNGLPYNPISLDYQKTSKGDSLKRIDQEKEVRRLVRAQNIIDKNNTGYNIITGEDKMPLKKYVAGDLRPRVEELIRAKVDERVKYVPVRDKYDYLDD